LPLLLGVVLGVVAAIVLVTVVSCCFCSCCILYKKRQPRLNGGPLYRMHCSSTASGVANMYSFSNPNSLATTPLDSAVANSRLLVDLEPVVAHSINSSDGRATMGRGHTFSRETRSTGMDVHLSELGEISTTSVPQSPEPPPPYDSSGLISRDEQHRDTTLQVLRKDPSLQRVDDKKIQTHLFEMYVARKEPILHNGSPSSQDITTLLYFVNIYLKMK
ncbi:hypothetical protein L9F63_020682, partial [Diploptera punctata]